MLLALAVLFVALSPGVLFTIPPLGKKMGGKFSSIVLHAIVFVIAVNLLNVVQEGFQMKNTFEKAADSGKQVVNKVLDSGVMVKKGVEKTAANVGAAAQSILGMGATSKK